MVAATLTLEEFAAFLHRKAEDLRRLDLTRPLKTIAVLAKADMKERFATATAPDGSAWLPLKRPRANSKGGDKPLRDNGILMASATAAGPKHVEEVTTSSLVVGTNLDYAPIQNFGGTIHVPKKTRAKPWVFTSAEGQTIFTRHIKGHDVTIPARQFVGWSEQLIEQSTEVIADYAAKEGLW